MRCMHHKKMHGPLLTMYDPSSEVLSEAFRGKGFIHCLIVFSTKINLASNTWKFSFADHEFFMKSLIILNCLK